jgi:hypothetical protein
MRAKPFAMMLQLALGTPRGCGDSSSHLYDGDTKIAR